MEIKSSFINNSFLPSFSFNEFHGSGVMTLYPYFNLIPSVFLSFIIKSKLDLAYVMFIFSTFLLLMFSFYSSKGYIKNYSTAYIFSIIYGLSPLLIFHSFITNDFGIVSTYSFFPLIIFGVLKIIDGKKEWIELSLGLSFVFFSHILNVIIIFVFLLLFILINIKHIDKFIIKNLLKSMLLFIIITSIIWLPFIFFYFGNLNNLNLPGTVQLNRISIKEFISGIYGSKNNDTIGVFPLISAFISIFFYKYFNKYIKQMYLLSILIILCLLFLPWELITSYGIFSLLNQFQFTFRFLFIPQMLLSFIFALIVSRYIKYPFNKKIIYFIIVVVTLLLQVTSGQYITIKHLSSFPFIEKYLKRSNDTINISNLMNYKINKSSQFDLLINNSFYGEDDDYIPKKALLMSKYVNHDLGFYNNNYIRINHVGYNKFNFSVKNNINKLSLPIYAYNKEKLHVYLNNNPVDNYADKNSLLAINNIKNNVKLNNEIYIKPSLDPFRITGTILSILGWLFALGVVIKRKLVH